MRSLADTLGYVQIGAFAALALVCFLEWRSRRGEAAFWALLTFGLLSAVTASGLVTDRVYGTEPPDWLTKIVVGLVVLFPYFLYRFAATFGRPSRRVESTALALTAAVVVWTLALPDFPQESEPRSNGFLAYMIVLLVQWTTLLLWVAGRLWRAGAGQPTVVRYRMRTLAGGALALSVALILAGFMPADNSAWVDVVDQFIVLAAALLFFAGFAPPRIFRKIWRGPEEDMLRRSLDDLMTATSPQQLLGGVLPQMAALVGARGVALIGEDGTLLAVHGVTPEMVAREETRAAGETGEPESVLVQLPLHSGAVRAWTSPYAPFFGEEEFDLLRSLSAFTLLALERSQMLEHERQAREALERTDELKTQFVALASHELRTPAAVIHGIAQTLHMRGEELSIEQIAQLRLTLYEQTNRMRLLVDQLLDLSRLEADAVRIEPQPFWVRNRVEELVLTVAAERTDEVSIDVAPELEAVADTVAFDRIVSNLIVNAFRYGKPPVSVAAEQRDRHFRLTVEDRGGGVPPEFVPELFERFTRSTTTRRDAGGAGLGLAIAKSYAHAHGGDLLYANATPHGARFELVLPQRPEGP